MTISLVGTTAATSSKTAGTSLAATTGFTCAAGELVLLWIGADNSGSGTAYTISSVLDSSGNTWAQHSQSPIATVAAAAGGSATYLFWSKITTAVTANALTVTFGASVTAKAMIAVRLSTTQSWGADEAAIFTAYAEAEQAAGTALTLSVTPTAAGQAVSGCIAAESDTSIYTSDTDTLEGSWSAIATAGTSGGGGASNISVGTQTKISTGTSAQSWSPGQGASDDSGILVIVTETAAAGATAPSPYRRRLALSMRGRR